MQALTIASLETIPSVIFAATFAAAFAAIVEGRESVPAVDGELDVAGVLEALLAVARSPTQNSANMSSNSSSSGCLLFFLFLGILHEVDNADTGCERRAGKGANRFSAKGLIDRGGDW